MARNTHRILWLMLLGASFGLIEAAVVAYLRQLLMPGGVIPDPFILDPHILRIEVIREAATLALLLSVAVLAGARPLRRFGVFALLFGVWDLTYYIWLWVFIGWPASFADWDILFLIPAPWAGPVWAPMLISVGLIIGGIILLQNGRIALSPLDWVVEILAGLLIISAFLMADSPTATTAGHFPLALYLTGLFLGAGWFAWITRRITRSSGPPKSVPEPE